MPAEDARVHETICPGSPATAFHLPVCRRIMAPGPFIGEAKLREASLAIFGPTSGIASPSAAIGARDSFHSSPTRITGTSRS
jgi:hypothetical protein